jgi:hypothetical protein
MRNISTKRFKAAMMCILALTFMTAGLYIYKALNSKPKCDCMFPNSKEYGVISAGGKCRVVPCEVGQPSK